jgi:hypothetical protein
LFSIVRRSSNLSRKTNKIKYFGSNAVQSSTVESEEIWDTFGDILVSSWGYFMKNAFNSRIHAGFGSYPAGDIVLTDREIREAKAKDKAYRLADARGLYLFVTPTATSKSGKLRRDTESTGKFTGSELEMHVRRSRAGKPHTQASPIHRSSRSLSCQPA